MQSGSVFQLLGFVKWTTRKNKNKNKLLCQRRGRERREGKREREEGGDAEWVAQFMVDQVRSPHVPGYDDRHPFSGYPPTTGKFPAWRLPRQPLSLFLLQTTAGILRSRHCHHRAARASRVPHGGARAAGTSDRMAVDTRGVPPKVGL